MLRRLARQTIASFIAWRHRRRVARAVPDVARIASEIEARRRKHQPIRRLLSAQRAIVKARLEQELGRKAS